jgi:hypothetical protein
MTADGVEARKERIRETEKIATAQTFESLNQLIETVAAKLDISQTLTLEYLLLLEKAERVKIRLEVEKLGDDSQ